MKKTKFKVSYMETKGKITYSEKEGYKVNISGYDCYLYQALLEGWIVVEKKMGCTFPAPEVLRTRKEAYDNAVYQLNVIGKVKFEKIRRLSVKEHGIINK